ncbi:diphthamide synthesis protein [Candidatus Woesearchaeota archaeon]|nr:diphthamide synthesis protein [Candidatus Woesearchaeota archaeon]
MQTYDLELNRVIEKIKETQAKTVCIQLPDGLKPRAEEIQDAIHAATSAELLIWEGSNYGACDFPLELSKIGVDLLVAWGHSEWRWQ